MMRPMSSSLPGNLARGENDRVAIGQLDLVLAERDPRQRRARFPCPPVATISTSRRGRLMAVSKSIVSGKSFR
jgi:hypothetical protein